MSPLPRLLQNVLLSLVTACTSSGVSVVEAVVSNATSQIPAHANNPSRLAVLQKRANETDTQILFVGDSIIEGGEGPGLETWEAWYARRKALKMGMGGDQTKDILARLEQGHFDRLRPKLIVLMIGINNLFAGQRPEEVVDGIGLIVRRLMEKMPDATLLLLGLLPCGEKPTDPMRINIARLNALLEKLADGKRIHYADMGPVFLAPDGRIAKDIMPDGLHPSAEGYRLWAGAMDPELSALLDHGLGADPKPLTRQCGWQKQLSWITC